MVTARRPLAFLLCLGAIVCGLPTVASAQRMDLALSRLRVPAGAVIPGSERFDDTGTLVSDTCSDSAGGYPRDFCQDDDSWRRLATEFTGGMIPPLLTPARTRGPRSFYLGVEGFLTGISSGDSVAGSVWGRGTEGLSDAPGATPSNRFPDSILGWSRLNIRKALPFGFDLGTNIGYLANTSYWTLGLEIRWAILEGWQSRDWWVPDIAVRGAVQTLVGDTEFNATTVAVDLTISNSIIIGDEFELSPYLAGQLAWAFADTELVDLTPDRDAFAECDPVPDSTLSNPCRPGTGSGADYNHNVVLPSVRTMRPRMVFGAQGRFEVFALTAAFSFDLLTPSEMDSSLPQPLRDPTTAALIRPGIDRQWRVDFGVGLVY